MTDAHSLLKQIQDEQQNASGEAAFLQLLYRYDDLLCRYPDMLKARFNRSILLKELGLYDLALHDIETVLERENENAKAWCHRAFLLNVLGRYTQGWQSYEWRWQLPEFSHPTDLLPAWQGEDIHNGRLLIYAEQGLGDNIQFVRYALLAKARGLNIIVVNHTALENLLNYNLALHEIATLSNGGRVGQVDYLVSMMSLPHLFGTTLDTIPYPEPYLIPQPDYQAKFAAKMPRGKRLKIGVVWAGSNKHLRNQSRSIPFSLFSSIFALDAEFHCLQKEISCEDLTACQAFSHLHLWHDQLSDFSDTAGLVSQLDLVISVDTSVAHLSAALGVPTWILISFNPDYRWLLHREDSPWYHRVRLFRQSKLNDWEATFTTLREQLQLIIKEHHNDKATN